MKGFKSRKDRIRPASAAFMGIAMTFAIGIMNRASAGTEGYIDTFAGGGPKNGEIATAAGLNTTAGVTADGSGNAYLTTYNQQVWKLSADGTLTLIAGTGAQGSTGDGGSATSATFYQPSGIALNSDGDLFIADTGNHKIRKIDHSTGIISTYAGTGTYGSTGDGSPAVSAALYSPYGIAVNSSGDLFIADSNNNKIRKVDHSTGYITTVAGTGSSGSTGDGGSATSAKLYSPRGIAVNSSGDLFIADTFNYRVRMVDHTSGYISAYAGTGNQGSTGDGSPAVTATIKVPYGVAVNSSGDLVIADYGDNKIRMVDHSTGYISTVAGSASYGSTGDGGAATSATLYNPFGVAMNFEGDLFIADSGNNKIRKIDHSTGFISTVAGNGMSKSGGDGLPAIYGQLYTASGVALNSDGDLFIADTNNNRIRKVDHSTGILSTVAGTGNADSRGDGGAATSATLNIPYGVALNSSGDLFIADTGNNKIRKVDHSTGIITTVAGTGSSGSNGDGSPATSAQLNNPLGIAFNSDGDLFIADMKNSKIRKVDHLTGYISTYAGTGSSGSTEDGVAATSAKLSRPTCVAMNSDGDLLIADTYGNKIRKVNHSTGIISTLAGTGASGSTGDGDLATSATLKLPFGVASDSIGDLFISDTYNHEIRMVNHLTEIITTIAGIESPGFSGDGADATSAEINIPTGLAFDPDGNLYVADANNNRIRIIYQAGADARSPAVSVGYGTSYSDSYGASYAGYGHSYIRIVAQDKGSGFDALSVTSSANALAPVIQEKTGDSTFVTGASSSTTNPVYAYLVKDDNASPASFIFSVCDKKGNYGAPSLTVSSLSFAKKDQTVTRSLNSVAKDQGKVSILANSGDLRNASVVANGETVEIGDVPAGTVRTVDLRSRLRAGTDNAISVTATGDAGASATALASSATLDRIDETEERAKRVYRRGDANEDGRIDVRDAAKLLRFLAGLESPTATERALCDVDLDGSLTAKDATTMIKLAVAR